MKKLLISFLGFTYILFSLDSLDSNKKAGNLQEENTLLEKEIKNLKSLKTKANQISLFYLGGIGFSKGQNALGDGVSIGYQRDFASYNLKLGYNFYYSSNSFLYDYDANLDLFGNELFAKYAFKTRSLLHKLKLGFGYGAILLKSYKDSSFFTKNIGTISSLSLAFSYDGIYSFNEYEFIPFLDFGYNFISPLKIRNTSFANGNNLFLAAGLKSNLQATKSVKVGIKLGYLRDFSSLSGDFAILYNGYLINKNFTTCLQSSACNSVIAGFNAKINFYKDFFLRLDADSLYSFKYNFLTFNYKLGLVYNF